jgi:hypothetical protein
LSKTFNKLIASTCQQFPRIVWRDGNGIDPIVVAREGSYFLAGGNPPENAFFVVAGGN